MTRYPIVFTYAEVVVGNGYVATVKITGRCLMEDFGNDDVWVTGVHPSGFSAGGENRKSASDAFQREHRVALLDMAHDAADFREFRQLVRAFFDQTSRIGESEWWKAVSQVRSGEVSSEWLRKVSADTRPTLQVRQIALDDAVETTDSVTAPDPVLNPAEYQLELLAA